MCGQTLGTTVGHNTYSRGSGGSLAAINYLEIKLIMDRWSTQQKQGRLTDAEVKVLVKDWHDRRKEANLNQAVADREMKALEAKLAKYNVDWLGEIPFEKADGTMRIMVCQMGGCTGKEVREIKMLHTEQLIQK
jgi:hypothetical protein